MSEKSETPLASSNRICDNTCRSSGIDSVVTVGYKRGDDVNLRGLPFGADYGNDGDDEEGGRRRCLMSGPGGIGPRTF